MNWTDEQRAAIETLVARDGSCTISTDDVSGVTERIGWNPPAGGDAETVNVRCLRLQEHLAAVLDNTTCDCPFIQRGHETECPWALAKAYLDSLEGGS